MSLHYMFGQDGKRWKVWGYDRLLPVLPSRGQWPSITPGCPQAGNAHGLLERAHIPHLYQSPLFRELAGPPGKTHSWQHFHRKGQLLAAHALRPSWGLAPHSPSWEPPSSPAPHPLATYTWLPQPVSSLPCLVAAICGYSF